jgi:hypothetical protein
MGATAEEEVRMRRTRLRAACAIPIVLTPLAVLAGACSRPPEQQMLTQYFRAARARDAATIAAMSSVELNPRVQGSVDSFTITAIGPETRAPLDFSALQQAVETARQAEADFQQRKKVYSNANLKTIEEVLKLERDPKAKMTPQQQAVKVEWDKWRADTATFLKTLADARSALSTATAPAEASLSRPGAAAFEAKAFKGEVVTKDVSIAAQFRSPEDQVSEKNLVLTLTRIAGTLNGEARDGRWIITKIAGL